MNKAVVVVVVVVIDVVKLYNSVPPGRPAGEQEQKCLPPLGTITPIIFSCKKFCQKKFSFSKNMAVLSCSWKTSNNSHPAKCRTLELERFVEKQTRNADIFSLYLFYVVKTTTRLEIGLSCFRFVVFVVVCIVQLLLLCLVFPSGYLVHINMAGQTPT